MNIRQLYCATVSRSFFPLFFTLMNNNKNYSGTYEPRTRRHNHVHLFDKLNLPLTFLGNISVEESFKHVSNMHYHIYSLARGIRAWFDTTANDFFCLSVLKSCPLLFWSSHVASHTLPFSGTLLTPTPILRSTPTAYPLLPGPLHKAPLTLSGPLLRSVDASTGDYGNEINTK